MSTPRMAVTRSHVQANHVDAAQQLAARLYGNVVISFGRPTADLCWKVTTCSLGSATVMTGEHNRDGEIRAEVMASQYMLYTLRQGASEVVTTRESRAIVPGESAVMLNPGMQGKAAWRAGMQSLNVILRPEALRAHILALTGTEVREAPRFKLPVDLRRGPAADLQRIVELLHAVCARTDGAPASPHVVAHLREALVGGLLSAAESTASPLLHRTPARAGRRSVRLVEEYLTAHAAEPISLSGLAGVTGISLRSLQREFRAAHGMSPREFLAHTRLDLARRYLLAAEPGTTVAQVLYACGFGHAGEFSTAYRKRFGERPSDTLRRSVGPEPARSNAQ
jgi:AraC-like DNA-binding protein